VGTARHVLGDYTFDSVERIDIQRHYGLDNGNVNMTTPTDWPNRKLFDHSINGSGVVTGRTLLAIRYPMPQAA
jgi:hypothetical protein